MTVSLIGPTHNWLCVLYFCLGNLMQRSSVILSENRMTDSATEMSFRRAMKLFKLSMSAPRHRIYDMKMDGRPSVPLSSTPCRPSTSRLHGPRTQLSQPTPAQQHP